MHPPVDAVPAGVYHPRGDWVPTLRRTATRRDVPRRIAGTTRDAGGGGEGGRWSVRAQTLMPGRRASRYGRKSRSSLPTDTSGALTAAGATAAPRIFDQGSRGATAAVPPAAAAVAPDEGGTARGVTP